METEMFTIPDSTFKDDTPVNTVMRIKEILKTYGIETEECWGVSNVPYCYSLRINIEGTYIGANGKGISKELALASGYGELIERLQLGLIWKNKLQIEGGASSCEAQSQIIAAEDLLTRNAEWYKAFAEKVRSTTGQSVTGRDILKQYTDSNGNIQATPFYCLSTRTKEYLPTVLCKTVYATSGGASGNTMEEAMVQAISEIVERHYKLRVIHEEIAVPEIPDEVLKSCSIAYEIIDFLRNNGYRVIVRDCSLGMKFPVVCVSIIDVNSGRYHTHFGAHPNFDIALQRTLTESFQGRNIHNIAKHEDFVYEKEYRDLRHLMVELVKGTSEKSPRFFFGSHSQPYQKVAGFSGSTNREYLKECMAFFREQGYDILVRDSSTLGFPTCQIIIPGYSEVLPQRMLEKYNDSRFSAYASRFLRNPTSANQEDMFGLMMHIAQSQKLKIYGVEAFTTEAGIPASLKAREEAYLMSVTLAHVSYTFGKPKDVIAYINKALQSNASRNEEYLICLKRYLSMVQSNYTDREIEHVLHLFHQMQTVEKLYSFVRRNGNPLDPVVLHCDLECFEDCVLYKQCKKKYADELVHLIVSKSKILDQSALEELLQSI